MRFSVHSALLPEHDPLQAVHAILSAGYDEVELNAEHLPWASPHVGPETPKTTREALNATQAICSIAAHREGLASPEADRRRAAIEWTIDCARLAADVGAPLIHVIPGDDPLGRWTGQVNSGDREVFAHSLREVVARSRPLGIRVSLEAIVNQSVDDSASLQQMLHEVPDLGVSLDVSHLQVTTGDIPGALQDFGPDITNVAIKDATGTPESFEFCRLGEGDVDFHQLLSALHQSNFTGPVTIEHESHMFGDTRPAAEVLRDSLEFLHRKAAPDRE